MSTIQLVYCRENADIAEKLAHELGRIGIPFQHHTNRPDDPPGHLARQVQASTDMVLLLLTDNFLRSEACMQGVLAMFQTLTRQRRLLTIVADGRVSRDGGHTFERVSTQFDRVVHAIQYMNFWQTAYLDRNAGSSQTPPAEKETYEQGLDVVRSIANEIGELFSVLRDAGYYTWDQFEADDYALFFRHFGLQDWYEQYRKLSALEAEMNVPPIPEQASATLVVETPAFTGLLAPAPAEAEDDIQIEEPHVFNGINGLLREIEAEEVQPEPEMVSQALGQELPPLKRPDVPGNVSLPGRDDAQSVLERLIGETEPSPEAAEAEARQMAQDAWFWLEKGHAERGLELFRLAIEQHPEQENLRSEYEKAQMQYGPHEPEIPEDEQPAAQPELPVEMPAQDHAQEAASYFQMGENALSKGDYLLAKYCWDRVTELQPQFPGIYHKLALLTCDHLTDYKETAAHYLEEALAAEPDNADLHFRLAQLLRDHLDQPAPALQHFRDTVVLQPDHAPAWLALAQCTLDAGDEAEAETLYRHAIQLNPGLHSEALDARFLPPAPPAEQPVEELPEPAFGSESFPEPEMAIERSIEMPAPPESDQTPQAEPVPVRKKTEEILTVLITGATSGIGRATAAEFARHGHRVILTGRRDDRLDDLKRSFESDYESDVHVLTFDVRDPEAVRRHLETLPENWQNIDLLINNAGLAKGLSPIHEGNLDHWDTMIDTNIKGLLYVTRCIAPGMVRRRKGHIINVGSVAGKEAYPKGNVYCATKFAVDALTSAMRFDLHAFNIRVSQVSPGAVEETEFAINRFDGDAEKARIYDDFQPLKASDVADAIYFIATRPAHVNIQDILMFGTQQASATVVDRSGR